MAKRRATSTSVLIVGAGPTGLALAALLQFYDIDFILIDKKEGVTDLSKALVMHARTMEVYDQIGLAQPAAELGAMMREVMILSEGRLAAKPDFSNIGGQISQYPYILVLGQSDNEELLYTHVKQNGGDVQWHTELRTLLQDDRRVTAAVIGPDGAEQSITADYLVGCDGASSKVRQLLDLGFEGATFPRIFYVADVEMDDPLPGTKLGPDSGKMVGMIGKNSYLLMVPRKGERHWRFTGNLPNYDISDRDKDIPFSEIENSFRQLAKREPNITKVNWFSKYTVHTRNVDRFQVGRCFVAGDAGHVHTPAGGQGMNTGIQDAYNLAWKLAFVLRAGASPTLLNSYHEERLANARHLIRTTDRIFDFLAGDNWYMQLARRYLLPTLAYSMSSLTPIRKRAFSLLSETGISYRNQSFAKNTNAMKLRVKPGDRMPFFEVDGTGIYHRLRAPKFHAVIFAPKSEPGAAPSGQRPDYLDVTKVPLTNALTKMFGSSKAFTVLLRPDNHVANIFEGSALRPVEAYLDTLLAGPDRVPLAA